MGSFHGFWNIDGQPISPDWFQKVNEVSSWWQPKSKRQYIHDNIAVSTHSMYDDSKKDLHSSSTIICTGTIRLDNRNELCAKFSFIQTSFSDIDIVSALFQREGIAVTAHLIGAFALVIFDIRNKTLYLIRDHIGVMPLHYYYWDRKCLGFATQKKSILCHPTLSKDPNWKYITRRIEHMGLRDAYTEYNEIHRVPPAHYLKLDSSGNKEIKAYWKLDVDQKTEYSNEEDYIETFRTLFSRAISDRIADQDRFGSHLSGGLDSSGVTAMAAKIARQQSKEIHAFSYIIPPKFEDHDLVIVNENPLVRAQIKFSQIDQSHLIHKPLLLNRRRVIELEAEVLDGYSESNNLQTELEIHTAMSENNIRVALSGFPGDELVTSFVRAYYLEYLDRNQYYKYFTSKYRGQYQLDKLIFPAAMKLGSAIIGPSIKSRGAKWYSKYLLRKGNNTFLSNHYYNPDLVSSNASMIEAIEEKSIERYIYGFPTTLREYQRNHISRTHTNRRMESEYIAGLQYGVTYRYPLADIRLLQYVLSIPMEQKIDPNGMSRLLFRKSMKSLVIDDIIENDNKKGVVKPMSMFYKKKTAKQLMTLYNYLKRDKRLDYLDLNKVELDIKENRLPQYFDQYLLIGCLIDQGKLNL